MNLSKPELQAFKTILQEPEITLKGFMTKTKLSKPRAYSTLRQLRSKKLIKSDGKPARYAVQENEETAQLSHLFKLYDSYPVEMVLSEKNHTVLREILHEHKNLGELMKATGLSRSQVYKILSRFAQIGLVKNFNEEYYIAEDHPLYKCLKEYEKPPEINPELEQDGAVLWQGGEEYLIQTEDLDKYVGRIEKPWKLTSSSAVGRYGVDVIPPKTTLYVADKKNQVIERSEGDYTSLEDTIVFTLLHDIRDSREYVRYLLLLHKNKVDMKYLRQKAKQYKIDKTLESILYDLKPVLKVWGRK